MTQASCDNYVTALQNLETACNNNLTTLAELQTLITNLQTAEDVIDNDILGNMSVPSTIQHFNSFILCQIERNTNSILHQSILNLIFIRRANVDNITTSYDDMMNYNNETKSIETYYDNLINSCNCMKNRADIIDKIRRL